MKFARRSTFVSHPIISGYSSCLRVNNLSLAIPQHSNYPFQFQLWSFFSSPLQLELWSFWLWSFFSLELALRSTFVSHLIISGYSSWLIVNNLSVVIFQHSSYPWLSSGVFFGTFYNSSSGAFGCGVFALEFALGSPSASHPITSL